MTVDGQCAQKGAFSKKMWNKYNIQTNIASAIMYMQKGRRLSTPV